MSEKKTASESGFRWSVIDLLCVAAINFCAALFPVHSHLDRIYSFLNSFDPCGQIIKRGFAFATVIVSLVGIVMVIQRLIERMTNATDGDFNE